jgi:hypothetical protein
MNTISSIASDPRLAVLMLAKLFKPAIGRGETAGAALASPSNLVLPGAVGLGRLSNATSQAVLALGKAGEPRDTQITNAPELSSSDNASVTSTSKTVFPVYNSTDQDNSIIKQANALTSQQLSDAMYGSGLAVTGVAGQKTTFSDILAWQRQAAESDWQQANDPSLSEQVRKAAMVNANISTELSEDLQKAYDDHSLVFQKASDVAGLDFQGAVNAVSYEGQGNKPPVGLVNDESYDTAFYSANADGKHHTMIDVGDGLMQYLTW